MAKLLQTGPHVDRALTLLALIQASTNPVERERYEGRLTALRTQHPEVCEIREDDSRIPKLIEDTRAALYNPPEAWRGTPPVERAAHLFGSFYAWRAGEICDEEGISEADRLKGATLADQRKNNQAICRQIHGAPEYGRKGCNCAAEQREREARGK